MVSKVLRQAQLQEKSQADTAQMGALCSPNMEAPFLDFGAFPCSTTLECLCSSNSSQ